jgi:hypothetical protein
MVVTPGPPDNRGPENAGRLTAHRAVLSRIDPINYRSGPESDTGGRIVFPALIPGASYGVIDLTANRDLAGLQIRKDFTVKPGETLDLGDIVIEKPP